MIKIIKLRKLFQILVKIVVSTFTKVKNKVVELPESTAQEMSFKFRLHAKDSNV